MRFGSKTASGLRSDIVRCVSRAVAHGDVRKLHRIDQALICRIKDLRDWPALVSSFEQDRAMVRAEIARLEAQ